MGFSSPASESQGVLELVLLALSQPKLFLHEALACGFETEMEEAPTRRFQMQFILASKDFETEVTHSNRPLNTLPISPLLQPGASAAEA